MNVKIDGNRSFFYQWDTGQRLIVECSDQCSEVHFSFKDDNLALVSPIKEIEGQRMATVPNILLQKEGTLYAYLFLRNEDGSETRRSISITVLSRPKPESYVYTETEILNYSYLDERLKDLEGEGLANAVAEYLEKNPIEAGATAKEAAQIWQNKADIEQLNEKLKGKTKFTINGEEPDETGNFIINTVSDVEIARLSATIT